MKIAQCKLDHIYCLTRNNITYLKFTHKTEDNLIHKDLILAH